MSTLSYNQFFQSAWVWARTAHLTVFSQKSAHRWWYQAQSRASFWPCQAMPWHHYSHFHALWWKSKLVLCLFCSLCIDFIYSFIQFLPVCWKGFARYFLSRCGLMYPGYLSMFDSYSVCFSPLSIFLTGIGSLSARSDVSWGHNRPQGHQRAEFLFSLCYVLLIF